MAPASTTADLRMGFPMGPYVERDDPSRPWLDEATERWAGRLTLGLRSRPRRGLAVARLAGTLAKQMADLGDDALRSEAQAAGQALRVGGLRDELVARCFALIREAARRRLGMTPHDVQLAGGYWMLAGTIAEMNTGEGKTLTATLPACTMALAGHPVHVITVNDYLVGRDAEEMGPVYEALGVSVGAIRVGSQPDERRVEYARDVTYVSNKDIAFDYLRDRIAIGANRSKVRIQLEELASGQRPADQLLLRGLCYAIVDEADSVLVDEARTPLILSAKSDLDPMEEELYTSAIDLARELEQDEDFKLDERSRQAYLTEDGRDRLERLAAPLGGVWAGPHRRGQLATTALSALHLFDRDSQYLVRDGKVEIIDESTGRVMPDRSWQRGLHQMIEIKEGVELSGHTESLAQISYQRFFRRYARLAGMTGTGSEIATELWSVYRLPVVRIPTHRPLKRKNLGDRVYATQQAGWNAVVRRAKEMSEAGRAVLIGTRSVAASESLSELLDECGLEHQVLNARQDAEEAAIVAEAGRPGCITVATNMAGRGTDIKLTPEVHACGGLHVIATERHESHRIDRQLFGRCGRQGDPGSYETIVSLEDEVVRAHGIGFVGRFQRLRARLQGDGDTASRSRVRLMAVRSAQRRAERLHAAMRRSLLKSDDNVASMLAFSGKGE